MKLLFERILLEKKEDESSAKTLANTQAFGPFTNPEGKDPSKWELDSDREAYYKALDFVQTIFLNKRDEDGNEISHQRVDCFNGAPGNIFKYITGIVRVIIDECDGNARKMQEFIDDPDNMKVFDTVISWARAERPKVADPNAKPDKPSAAQEKIDNDIMHDWKFEDFINKADEIEEERENADYEGSGSMESSDFEIIPIESYDQMHELFGGRKTGLGGESGQGKEYSTDDGGAWCHTNGKTTYDSSVWTDHGRNKFFVLANKNWENIPPDIGTNYGKNDYGHSLMALLVGPKGNLMKCTLRCNHEGIRDGGFPADNAYTTYAELSEIAGFDVGKAIKDMMGIKPFKVKNGTFEYFGGRVVDADNFEQGSDEKKVKRVVVKDGVTVISSQAFKGLTYLKEVVLSDSVITIGDEAFSGCTALESISFPETLTTVGAGAFKECRGLDSISFPDGVTSIGPGCFEMCVNLHSVELPSSLESISNRIFNKCSELPEVIIPDSVTKIYDNAFSNCISINSIVIPDSVTEIRPEAFSGCTYLENVKLSSNMDTLQTGVFNSCYSLKSVDFGGVRKIEQSAFSNCGSFSLYIPDSVIAVAKTAFSGCDGAKIVTNSTSIYHDLKAAENRFVKIYGHTVFTVSLDASVQRESTEVAEYTRTGLRNLYSDEEIDAIKYVKIKEGVTDIEFDSFENMKSLIGFTEDSHFEDITDIDSGAFKGCSNLQSFPFDKTVKLDWLGDEAFRGCTSLRQVIFPDGCIEVSKNCFADCTSLQYFKGGSALSTISEGAFANSGLVKIDGLDGVTKIKSGAFANCKDLKVIVISNNRRVVIDQGAFDGCESLEGVYYASDSVAQFCNANGIPCAKIE